MLQNTIALSLVSISAGYAVYTFVKGLISKKIGKCDGCAGCSFKENPSLNHRMMYNSKP